MKKKVLWMVLLMVIGSMLMSSCYFWQDVEEWQMGVQTEKNEITKIVTAGKYTKWCTFCELNAVDVSTVTFEVSDEEVATYDNQVVRIIITIQAHRKKDTDSITNLFKNWQSLMRSDDELIKVISATANEGIKNGVRSFILQELLDDRNGLATAIKQQLELDAEKYSVNIVNVTVKDIGISEEYLAVLGEKALITAQTEKEVQRQKLINQQAENDVLQAQQDKRVLDERLLVEKAQTNVDVEIASREGKKITEAMAVYELNDQAYEIKRLELMGKIFGDKSVFWIPLGTNLTSIINVEEGLPKVLPVLDPTIDHGE